MAKKKATKEATREVLNVPVQFSNVSIGDQVARIGVAIDRDNLNIDAADECLCGRRLTGLVIVLPPGEDAAQMTMIDKGDRHEISGSFDVKGFSANRKRIAAGLTFPMAEIPIEQLGHFAKKSGRLIVHELGEIPEEHKAKAGDDDEDRF